MRVYYVAGIKYSDDLYHHGIKGQKWGVQNGPPYPLGESDHSSEEKKRGWKSSLDKDEKQTGNWSNKNGLTKNQKRLIALGIAAVAVGAAAYYDYKTGDLSAKSMNFQIKLGQDMTKLLYDVSGYTDEDYAVVPKDDIEDVREAMDDENAADGTGWDYIGGKLYRMIGDRGLDAIHSVDSLESIKMKPGSILDEARKVNPNYSLSNPKTSSNCGLCSIAFDLRMRGYNVFAGLSDTGMTRKDFQEFFPGAKRIIRFGDYDKSAGYAQKPMSESDADSLLRSFSKEINTRGSLIVSWGYTGGGHAMSYVVSDSGKLQIIDPQSGNVFSDNNLKKFLKTVASLDSYRTDNLEPNYDLIIKKQLVL